MSWQNILKNNNLVKYAFYAESSKPIFRVVAELLDGVKKMDEIEHLSAKNISNSEHMGFVKSDELDSLEILLRMEFLLNEIDFTKTKADMFGTHFTRKMEGGYNITAILSAKGM
jgi:hypothetical protein